MIAVAPSSAIGGPGAYSLDAAVGFRLSTEVSLALVILIGLGVVMALASRLTLPGRIARWPWRSTPMRP